ncbi:MAG: hypothetical protein HDS21_06420 [Bacteroides sp.]|nr:hypothetical protein [Bacteroides sp.]
MRLMQGLVSACADANPAAKTRLTMVVALLKNIAKLLRRRVILFDNKELKKQNA